MRIVFTYNVKHNLNYSTQDSQEDIEFDSQDVIDAIKNTLERLGHAVTCLEADLNAYEVLRTNRTNIDLVFNIAEGLRGDARESQIPIFCEMLGIPYTHSSPTTNAIKLNKHLTKLVLTSVGVKCPKSCVVLSTEDLKAVDLNFPLIVKPNKEGSSKGIFNDSVVRDEAALKRAVWRLVRNFKSEVLIEEYIDGRELTVGMLGSPVKVLPIVEQKFDFLPKDFNKVAGYELKWIYEDKLKALTDAYDCPAKLTPRLKSLVVETSKKVWETLHVRDCARIDYRLRGDDLYFLEINTLPGINPDEKIISYFPLAARNAGLSFEDLLAKIIKSAVSRH